MPSDKLTPLQRRILRVLAPIDPPWTLTSGAALAGIHLGHRANKDLDLIWRERYELGRLPSEAGQLLRSDALAVSALRTTAVQAELQVEDRYDVCVVGLVADPCPVAEPPQSAVVDGSPIAVDSMHEILVDKLTALLGRTELRDLLDVQAVLESGVDLTTAVRDASKKGGGFSAMTLAWLLNGFEIAPPARALGWRAEEMASLDAFRLELIDRLTRSARPK